MHQNGGGEVSLYLTRREEVEFVKWIAWMAKLRRCKSESGKRGRWSDGGAPTLLPLAVAHTACSKQGIAQARLRADAQGGDPWSAHESRRPRPRCFPKPLQAPPERIDVCTKDLFTRQQSPTFSFEYPYPDHTHQQRPMPTHAIQIAPMYSKIV